MNNFEEEKFNINFEYLEKSTIAIIGLGYVGLPLALEFDKTKINVSNKKKLSRKIIGFDIDSKRIDELNKGFDKTQEIESVELKKIRNLKFTKDANYLKNVDVFVVCVPTPIDEYKNPDLYALKESSSLVGRSIRKRLQISKFPKPIVIFESTVYPGCTEEICIPIIEKAGGIKLNEDFYCGYSPERINPGDSDRKINNIVKVTSGSCKEASLIVDKLYSSIIEAGTFKAKSIKVAEAAKIIENTQRDINIALINELALIFNRLNISTKDVLEAASTKWNFINFKPGLVGGHCIGVDPYYLAYKSKSLGYYPEIILSGRRINDGMSDYIVEQFIFNLMRISFNPNENSVLILGVSFKENCPDYRNSLVIDIINKLKGYNLKIEIVDPYVNQKEILVKHNICVMKSIDKNSKYKAILVCVAHDIFKNYSLECWQNLIKDNSFIYDVKGIVPDNLKPIRL